MDEVKPIPGNPVKWEVKYSKVKEKMSPLENTAPEDNTQSAETEIFDAVMVCNG